MFTAISGEDPSLGLIRGGRTSGAARAMGEFFAEVPGEDGLLVFADSIIEVLIVATNVAAGLRDSRRSE